MRVEVAHLSFEPDHQPEGWVRGCVWNSSTSMYTSCLQCTRIFTCLQTCHTHFIIFATHPRWLKRACKSTCERCHTRFSISCQQLRIQLTKNIWFAWRLGFQKELNTRFRWRPAERKTRVATRTLETCNSLEDGIWHLFRVKQSVLMRTSKSHVVVGFPLGISGDHTTSSPHDCIFDLNKVFGITALGNQLGSDEWMCRVNFFCVYPSCAGWVSFLHQLRIQWQPS